MVGATPLSRFSDYLRISIVKENDLISDGKTGMTYILDTQNQLLELEREILMLST